MASSKPDRKAGRSCRADDQVQVIGDLDAAEQQQGRLTLPVRRREQRSNADQPPILPGSHDRQFGSRPFAPAAGGPPRLQVFVA